MNNPPCQLEGAGGQPQRPAGSARACIALVAGLSPLSILIRRRWPHPVYRSICLLYVHHDAYVLPYLVTYL